jgi:Fe-S cluster assembly protein SufD
MKNITVPDDTIINRIERVSARAADLAYSVGGNSRLTLALLIDQSVDLNVTVNLTKPHSQATVVGLVKGNGMVRLNTMQHHVAPDTTSNLLVKSVLGGGTDFSFTGIIRLEKTAQKTDAYQRNDNLIISDTAHAQSRPVLEILANDVRCTHGSATGRFNPEELWYLMSRGISRSNAEKLITYGYWQSGLNLIADAGTKRDVARMISAWV